MIETKALPTMTVEQEKSCLACSEFNDTGQHTSHPSCAHCQKAQEWESPLEPANSRRNLFLRILQQISR